RPSALAPPSRATPLPGPWDADCELLLDVGAPARARHDRDRARQVGAERFEELFEAGQDCLLAHDRDVRPRKQRTGARLVAREQDDRAGVGKRVGGVRDLSALELRDLAAVDREAGLGGAL